MRANAVVILMAVGFFVYFNSLFNGFVWDDEEQILNNSLVHSINNLPSFFAGSTFNTGGSGSLGGLYYKPMMTIVFSLIYSVFGSSPFIYHSFQLIIHIANSILLFLIFKHFFSRYLLPLILSLIFLVHPINTETVVYISSLQDTLYLFFGISAFWIYINSKKQSLKSTLTISLLLLLSLLSKETGALFTVILFIHALLFKKSLKTALLPFFLTTTIYSILRFLVAGVFFNKHNLSPITTISFVERLTNIPQIAIFYLKTFIFPYNLIISQQWVIKSLSFNEFVLPLIITTSFFGILIALYVIFYRNNTDSKKFLFFLGWFTLSFGLHLQIFPLDMTVADRWFYMPMVGILGLIGLVFGRVQILLASRWDKAKSLLLFLIVVVLALFSLRTIIRNTNWKDGLTLYSHDSQLSRESFDLENNLGVELFRNRKYDEAKVHYERSVALAPQWWTNWNNLGVIYDMNKDYKKAKDYYTKAIANGDYYLAYENLAKVLLSQDEPGEAKLFIEESLKKLPRNANLWLYLAIAEYRNGDEERAKQAAKNSYLLKPDNQAAFLYTQIEKKLPVVFSKGN